MIISSNKYGPEEEQVYGMNNEVSGHNRVKKVNGSRRPGIKCDIDAAKDLSIA